MGKVLFSLRKLFFGCFFLDTPYFPVCLQDYRNTSGPNFMKLGGTYGKMKNPLHRAKTHLIFHFKIWQMSSKGTKHRHHVTISIRSSLNLS